MQSANTTLDTLRLPQLKARCKALGITGYSKWTKAQLIARLQATDQPDAIPPIPRVPLSQDQEPSLHPRSSSTASSSLRILPKKAPATLQEQPLDNTGTILSPINASPCRKLSEQITTSKNPLIIPQPIQTVPITAKTAPPSKRFRKETPALKTAPSNNPTSTNKKISRLPLVILKRKSDSTSNKPFSNASVSNIARHRLPGVSNSSHLVDHFSIGILRNLYTASRSTNTFKPFLSDHIINGPEAVYEIALRFWVARLHTILQMGGGEAWSVVANSHGMLSPDIGSWPTIASCQQVSGDVWEVVTSDACVYLFIGPSGDVIHRDASGNGAVAVRPDWQAYLSSPFPLSSLVKTKEITEFPGGIFKGFRGGSEERQIAERIVLSSCVMQSFSGQAMSAIELEAEYLGQSSCKSSRLNGRVDLFLPESHQILSVHLTSHPSIAVVQRNAEHIEYVLRETGQVVGGDEGVAPLWQGLLGCTDTASPRAQPSFWQGWERRCAGLDE